MSFDSYFTNIGGYWNEMARPSVHAGAQSRRNVEREVDQLFDRLLSAGGRRTPTARTARADDLQRLGYHESGHAVVAYALGIPLSRVEIDVHSGAGFTERGNGGDMWTVQDAAAWLYGGQVAEVQRFGFSRGAVDDDEVLRGLDEASGGGKLDQAHALARDTVAANWGAVVALADALIARRALDSYDVEKVLSGRMRRHAGHRGERAESRSAGPVEITVHGHRANPRTGAWEPYTKQQAVDWPQAKADAWNRMYAATDQAEFFRWQDILASFGR